MFREKKAVSGILLTLLLVSVFMLAFNAQPVDASGTVYIRADGSIEPSDAPISTADNITYTLTGNITTVSLNDGIVIERDNIVLDGAGHTLQGTGTYYLGVYPAGIALTGRDNITIRNMEISAFFYGMWLDSSSGNSVSGNNITNNNYHGIQLYHSSSNSIVGNSITSSWICGIGLNYSSSNTLSRNNMTDDGVCGIGLSYSSDYNIVSENSITGMEYGILLDYSSSDYNIISGNSITGNDCGILVRFSSGNTISGNDITANYYCGISLFYSSSNSVDGNNITVTPSSGIYLERSSDNRFCHNNFINNSQQVGVYESGYANIWDDGYPSGGNYWSDYSGNDSYSGPYQNETLDSDNIGDVPYVIDADNVDNYPLMYATFENRTIYRSDVYIKANGTIDPSTAPILTLDNVTYTLTYDINGQIFVERDNIIIDGNGYTLQGDGWRYPIGSDPPPVETGITLSGRDNVTVQNTEITAFHCAIHLINSSKISIRGNYATDNWEDIILTSSSNNILSGNNIADDYMGIVLDFSSNISISGNNITSSYGYGIHISSSSNVSIVGNNMADNAVGIMLVSSSNNSIGGNNMAIKDTYSRFEGIGAYQSSSNIISGNNIASKGFGIGLGSCSDNIISGNNIADCYAGISVAFSSNTNIDGNNLTHNTNGIFFNSSSSNCVCRNNITANTPYGIRLSVSSNNDFYHNNFVGNVKQVYIQELSYPNVWDDGYPSGGNCWSDYNGTDLFSGPYQNETGSDRIGDTSYIIDASNRDRYPLMVHDVAVTNVTPSRTVAGQGYSVNLNVTVANQGSYTEDFNATAYANTTVITSQNVTLPAGKSTTVMFTCNTTGFSYGNYTIAAYAGPIPGETNTADNNCTCIVPVHIGVPGDVSGITQGVYDDTCNMRDINYLIMLFNTRPSSLNWNPNADVNDDGVCNMRDIQIAILNFNKHE